MCLHLLVQVKLTNSVATKTIAISARLFDSAESAIHRMMGSSKAADAAPVEAQPAEAPTQPAAEEKPSYAAAVAKAEPIEEDFVEAPGAAKK